MKTTIMYMKGSCIISVNAFLLLLLLLSSCGKNRYVSEFVVDPPYETKVEYIKDTIKLTEIDLDGPTEKYYTEIWVKKDGKYYAHGDLIISTEEHTDSFSTKFYTGSPIKGVSITRKIGKDIYSYKTYLELAPHQWEMHNAIIYDKSYRIIKFQNMLACDFILKK